MKKIFLISFLFLVIALPGMTQAQTGGLVPCGYDLDNNGTFDPKTEGCTLCHLFQLTNNVLGQFFGWVVPTVAVLMLVIGGAMFFFAGAKPDVVNKSKGIITSVIVGLLIIFSAWVIVNTVLEKIGIDKMPSGWQWWRIECSAGDKTTAQIPEQAAPPTPPMPPVPW